MTQQRQKYTNLKVGLTVFTGLLILFIFTILVGINDYLFSKTFNMYINLENTAGLVKGAPVTLGGYKIGDVEAVEFVVVNNQTNIRIKLRTKSEYKNQIRTDSKVRITSIGILGEKFVDISIGDPNNKSVAENSYLEVEQTLSLDNIAQSITPGLENFNKIMENLKTVTDSAANGNGTISQLLNTATIIEGIKNVVNRIDGMLYAVENKNSSLNKILNDTELYDALAVTVGNLKMVSENLTRGEGTLGKLLVDESIYNNLDNSLKQLDNLIQRTQSDSTIIGGLLNDKHTYKKIGELINELTILITDIKENPEKYFKVSVF